MYKAWNIWKGFAQKVGAFQANIIFSVMYFLVLTPVAVIARVFYDIFKKKGFPIWSTFENEQLKLENLHEQ